MKNSKGIVQFLDISQAPKLNQGKFLSRPLRTRGIKTVIKDF